MKENTGWKRWFAAVDGALCALICCSFEETWSFRIIALLSGIAAAVLIIWDLRVSKAERFHDYMYLYFQKEKPEGEDKPDDGKPRGRFIVRAVIMVALIYLCVREDEWIVGAGSEYGVGLF